MLSLRNFHIRRFLIFPFICTMIFELLLVNPISLQDKKLEINGEKDHPTVPFQQAWALNGTEIKSGSINKTGLKICSDANEGIFIAWFENQSDVHYIYAQHLDAQGNKLWDPNGIQLFSNINKTILEIAICESGDGGFYIATFNDTGATDKVTILLNRISATGVNATGSFFGKVARLLIKPRNLQMVKSTNNDAILCYEHLFGGLYYRVMTESISYLGNSRWNIMYGMFPEGIYVSVTDGYNCTQTKIIADSTGGAIFTFVRVKDEGSWVFWGNPFNFWVYHPGNISLILQRYNSGLLYTSPGKVLHNGFELTSFDMVLNNSNGVFVVWGEQSHPYNVSSGGKYYQFVNYAGSLLFGSTSKRLYTTGIDVFKDITTVLTEENNYLFQYYVNSNPRKLCYSLIDVAGNSLMPENYTIMCTINDTISGLKFNQNTSAIYGAWMETKSNMRRLYIQKVNGSGSPLWGSTKIKVCDAPNMTLFTTTTTKYGLFICWSEQNGTNSYIKTKFVNNTTTVEVVSDPVNTNGYGLEQIQFIIKSFHTSGSYRIIYYDALIGEVYQDWTAWTNNTLIQIPVLHSQIGSDIYEIECVDSQDYTYAEAKYVKVNVLDASPVSTNPGDITTNRRESNMITWTITDDYGSGNYRVWMNDSLGRFGLMQNWTTFTHNTPFSVSINRSWPGLYEYTLQYTDGTNYGTNDTVKVTVEDILPTCSQPANINTTKSETIPITIKFYDDFGDGQYRVVVSTASYAYEWIAWKDWQNNTLIEIPINRTTDGIFTYTIEFRSITGDQSSYNMTVRIGEIGNDEQPGNPNMIWWYLLGGVLVMGVVVTVYLLKKRQISPKNKTAQNDRKPGEKPGK